MWIAMLDAAESVEDQLIYTNYVKNAQLDGAEAFYAKALDKLVNEYPSLRSPMQLNAADSIARTVIPPLGDAKYEDASADLWQSVLYFANPLVKSDALIALGKIGNKAYLPNVIQVLKDRNAQPQADSEMRLRDERIAVGAITSLVEFKDPAGYEPVFFASIGWYSAKVRMLAQVSLPEISDDPTDFFIAAIKSSSLTGIPVSMHPFEAKRQILQKCEESQAPNEKKALVALAALTEGWRVNSNDMRMRYEITAMRKQALNMLARYSVDSSGNLVSELAFNDEKFSSVTWPNVKPEDRDTSEELCAGLRKSYEQGDMDEKLAAINVLKVIGSQDTARMLSYFLGDIQKRRQSNSLKRDDEQLVRVIIPALGATRRSLAKPALLLVQHTDAWGPQIQGLAGKAIEEIDSGPR